MAAGWDQSCQKWRKNKKKKSLSNDTCQTCCVADQSDMSRGCRRLLFSTDDWFATTPQKIKSESKGRTQTTTTRANTERKLIQAKVPATISTLSYINFDRNIYWIQSRIHTRTMKKYFFNLQGKKCLRSAQRPELELQSSTKYIQYFWYEYVVCDSLVYARCIFKVFTQRWYRRIYYFSFSLWLRTVFSNQISLLFILGFQWNSLSWCRSLYLYKVSLFCRL